MKDDLEGSGDAMIEIAQTTIRDGVKNLLSRQSGIAVHYDKAQVEIYIWNMRNRQLR
jgi:hypothetical protein